MTLATFEDEHVQNKQFPQKFSFISERRCYVIEQQERSSYNFPHADLNKGKCNDYRDNTNPSQFYIAS